MKSIVPNIFRKYIIYKAYELHNYEYWNRTQFFREMIDEAYNNKLFKSYTINGRDMSSSKRWNYYLDWLVENKWLDFKSKKGKIFFKVLLPVEQINEFKKEVLLYKLSL